MKRLHRLRQQYHQSMALNPAQIRFMNKQLIENKRLKRELAKLRAGLATKLYQLSEPNNGN